MKTLQCRVKITHTCKLYTYALLITRSPFIVSWRGLCWWVKRGTPEANPPLCLDHSSPPFASLHPPLTASPDLAHCSFCGLQPKTTGPFKGLPCKLQLCNEWGIQQNSQNGLHSYIFASNLPLCFIAHFNSLLNAQKLLRTEYSPCVLLLPEVSGGHRQMGD